MTNKGARMKRERNAQAMQQARQAVDDSARALDRLKELAAKVRRLRADERETKEAVTRLEIDANAARQRWDKLSWGVILGVVEEKAKRHEQTKAAAECARRRNTWARDLVAEMVEADPKMSARALFEIIPEAMEAETDPQTGLEVYREGERLFAVDDKTGEVSEVSFESWRRYVRDAKNSRK